RGLSDNSYGGIGRRKRERKIFDRLACLNRQIMCSHQVPLCIKSSLGAEDQAGSRGDRHVGIAHGRSECGNGRIRNRYSNLLFCCRLSLVREKEEAFSLSLCAF